MSQAQAQAVALQKLEELGGAIIRSITGNPSFHLRNHSLYRNYFREPINTPHVASGLIDSQNVNFRGVVDCLAVRQVYSDFEIFHKNLPEEPIGRLIYDLLEQLRTESIVPNDFPGIKTNLKDRFVEWSLDFHHSKINETQVGILMYTLAQMAWSRLNGFRVVEETEDFIEATRAGIASLIGSPLALLKRHKFDQEEYAKASLVIVKTITDLIDSEYEELDGDEIDDTSSRALKFLLAFDSGDETSFNSISSGVSRAYIDDHVGYRVFTRQYDSEERITELIRHDHLLTLRENLDKEVYNSHINIKRFAKSLHEVFAEPLEIDWNFGEEQGHVDGRRLSQLVASKSEKRVFFLPRVEKKVNAQLTLLIDCSGSMKEYGSDVAVLIDILGRALVLAGVNVEILGFTTKTWSGGRPQADWFSQGRPMGPGRLNEVRHIIFKPANTQWHKARRAIAGLLKPDIFKESVDGEAVEWALSRLNSSGASKKSIVVLSDGCPMDSATNLANDKFYLDNHLKEVVKKIELSGDVEIFGLGVGLDLSIYYSKCAALDLGEGVNQKVLDGIVALLQKKHRR